MTQLTPAEVQAIFDKIFPIGRSRVVETGPLSAKMRLETKASNLRPGGTVSGPTLMGLADAAMYAAILAQNSAAVMAVTANLNINFLRRPQPGVIVADARILKLGKRLAVGEVYLYANDEADPVAHVTLSYAMP